MIVLVGFMGAGKSTVGRLLAHRIGLPFVDADDVICARAGRSIPEIFETSGEAAFRRLESEVVAELLNADGDAVVALGGGALGDANARSLLADATVVHMQIDLEGALERSAASERPMLAQRDPAELYAERSAQYEEVRDHEVDARAAPEFLAGLIAHLWRNDVGRPLGLVAMEVIVPQHPHPVWIGPGAAARVGDLLPPLEHAEKAVLVTHTSLEELAEPTIASLAALGLEVTGVAMPEGETSKTLAGAAALYDEMARAGLHRHDIVVSFGGGVVSDLAGFVASTYSRGIDVVHVPTTLLGQVDAALGGKTGVNLDAGKNLVGTFHQPLAVFCDVGLLATLDDAELRSGLAEVVKYGLICSEEFLDHVEQHIERILARDPVVLTEIVAGSVSYKALIVAQDEREAGVRAHLNYGHTFAHAIEQTQGYGSLRHGEAVALGMMAAAYLAHEMGRIDDAVVERHRSALAAAGLPTSATLDIDTLTEAWRLDKKYRGGVRFVLLNGIGRPESGIVAPEESLKRALERMSS